ncbi:MAG: DsbE family thiol:disulfide interchange protein [Candidatus Nitrotoga sp.]|jgi:cytochrome c biogenesis protein CcmG, thiol:disulfide interchange protein DsbE|nr:DsbE family thiol:disulfide interchange protein [Nitrosomonadales bacterium]MDO9101657.1 DsbE family thiol:disulfide interchange protein [Candidatus Nitrotoga sp.]RFC39955.1 MAG: cytochrome c biogenesis protein CcmG, thiol:disulfide interchange protein DsbE [Candidatus Nitrotoga sp. CP45]MDO9446968.1 DsbE family thiol:disulfide interchange protein [Candidatus Nitrotoga sp.]MDP1637778.1 DsbE family thiol:disulfide interchange protein [Candidatus Nitrotoga sp.]
MNRFLLPLGAFIVLVIFLWIGLTLNPREVPSPLINKIAPTFRLPQLHDAAKTIGPEDLRGKVWLLNVWASWCVTCRQEHPLLVELGRQKLVPIYGLNYKDNRDDGLALLRNSGDPYTLSAYDREGNVGIDWGVYGVPETFVIDKSGLIRHKFIGALTPELIQNKLIPLVKELNGA